MEDKIKLVYNWIGPRGPTWNTELPNVLNFSEKAVGAGPLKSSKYFDDDIVKFFQAYQPYGEYEVFPAFSIHSEDHRPFILPFTLSWRINFENYFTGNEGILEFSHTPDDVINFVRHRNGYILINHSIEAFMEPRYLDPLHSYFGSVHRIPLHKIIYLTGCINANEVYEQYCSERNIPDHKNNRLTIVTHPISFTSFVDDPEHDVPPYNPDVVPEKLFLMWNRRLRDHRADLVLHLERTNLLDRSLVSFSDEDPDFPGNKIITRFNRPHLHHHYNIGDDIIERFQSKLPLILDGEDNNVQMCQDYNNKSRPYYQQTLVSIVTETNFYDTTVSLTEKSFKPSKEKHPFIIAGLNGVLKGMRELGFKTFGEFWDESYDDIADPVQRMHAIMNVIEQIGQWTPDQILDFKRRVQPILEHNYMVIRTASTKHAADKITHIVRNRL